MLVVGDSENKRNLQGKRREWKEKQGMQEMWGGIAGDMRGKCEGNGREVREKCGIRARDSLEGRCEEVRRSAGEEQRMCRRNCRSGGSACTWGSDGSGKWG